jgi:excisionase family DNA binding protein
MKPPSDSPARLVDGKEAARYLSISRSAFRALVAARRIPRVVVPGANGQPMRRLLVDLADLDRLIAAWKRT